MHHNQWVLDLSLDHNIFFDLLGVWSSLPVFSCSITALRDNTTLDRLRFNLITGFDCLVPQLSRFLTGRIDLRTRQECCVPSMSTRRPPNAVNHAAFYAGPIAVGVSRSSSFMRTASARESTGRPSAVSMLFTSTSTSSPGFTVISPFSVNSAGFTMPSDL